jgi:hypothetical protein
MASFVVWQAEVPSEAKPIPDWAARAHVSPWIRRHIGKGIVQSYVVGYTLHGRWWTYFFDRVRRTDVAGPQSWRVEAYNNHGPSWSNMFLFWPSEARWRHSPYFARGDNFGRRVIATSGQTSRAILTKSGVHLNIAARGRAT